jgi:hypothetical protein
MEAFTGPTELHPLHFGPRQTGVDPFPDDAALELCKHAEHLEHRLAAEYRAGIERAIAKGWQWRHESGTYVKFTDAGAELFA